MQDHRFPPGVVHAADDLRRVAFLREIRLHRNHDRGAESEQVAGANVPEGMPVIRLIFFRAMMAQADLVLIVEPGLIVLGVRGVEDPLAETFPHGSSIGGVDLASLGIFVIGAQMRVVENDAAPGIEKVVDLIREHIVGQAQVDGVLFGKQGGFLQGLPFIQRDRRLCDFIRAVIVTGNIFMLSAGYS